ncbi:hypothetical protein RB195_026073 [Necator americanus]|uniref:Uncharacterized protein n=1 Tax=Necator americanus TaxID=51031 RepID=A0ABR1EVB9_NECAM
MARLVRGSTTYSSTRDGVYLTVPSFCSGSDRRLLRAKIRLSHTMEENICYRGLRACAEPASKPHTTNLDRISKTTWELLERRRALRLDPSASHIGRNPREYNIPLPALLSEDETRTSSRREIEIITERFYSNLFRSSTPMSSPIIPTGKSPPRILPSKVRVAIKSMKPGTASGPDFISADFLRACGHPLNVSSAHNILPSERKDPRPVKDLANRSYP